MLPLLFFCLKKKKNVCVDFHVPCDRYVFIHIFLYSHKVFDGLAASSAPCRAALAQGDLAALGAVVDKYWLAKRFLASASASERGQQQAGPERAHEGEAKGAAAPADDACKSGSASTPASSTSSTAPAPAPAAESLDTPAEPAHVTRLMEALRPFVHGCALAGAGGALTLFTASSSFAPSCSQFDCPFHIARRWWFPVRNHQEAAGCVQGRNPGGTDACPWIFAHI